MNQLAAEIIHDIMDARLSDKEFLEVIHDLPIEPLKALGSEIEKEVTSLRLTMKKHIKQYKDTGIPASPARFHRLKKKRTVREKQRMMLRHRVNQIEEAV